MPAMLIRHSRRCVCGDSVNDGTKGDEEGSDRRQIRDEAVVDDKDGDEDGDTDVDDADVAGVRGPDVDAVVALEDDEEGDERPEVTELERQREAVGAATRCWLGGSLCRGRGGLG